MKITFEWVPDFSVGNIAIDSQHKKLLAKINELLMAILNNQSAEVLAGIVQFLDSYIDEHLAYEEVYMQENSYPEINAHIGLHKEFIAQYEKFKNTLSEVGATSQLAHDVEHYIGDWWINHIGKEDKKYYEFILKNKIDERKQTNSEGEGGTNGETGA